MVSQGVIAQNPQRVKSEESSRHFFEKAVLSFEQGDYGEAFKYLNTAKENRKQETEWSIFVLEQALKPTAVQSKGDLITDLVPILQEREASDALEVIDSALANHSIDYFENSIQKIKQYIKQQSYFPETDYLIGKIYLIEGEFDLTEEYFLSAWEKSDFFDIPEERFDVLYSLASLYKQKNDKAGYEKCLVQIINDADNNDKTYLQNLDKAMIQSLKNGITLDKFFLLYRLKSEKTIEASIKLSNYYLEENMLEQAYIMSIHSALSAFTRIYEVIIERDMDYEYKDFNSFLLKLLTYSDIKDWAENHDIWRSFYQLASLTSQNGNKVFSKELYRDLSMNCPDLYWQALSEKALQ